MKVWCSRAKGCLARRGLRRRPRAASGQSGAAARRMLVQARVGADRPDEAFPALVAGDEPRQRCARRDEHRVVGDRRVDLGEMAADLLLGRPARRQADREPRDRRAGAVDDGEVFLEREREQRARPLRGAAARRARRRSPRRRRRSARRRRRGPSRAAARRSGSHRRPLSSRGRCRGSSVPPRRRRREASRARRRPVSTAAPGRRSCRAPRPSRAGACRRARSP